MPPDYDLLPSAVDDLLDLAEYAKAYSDETLERLVDAIYDCFDQLADLPGLRRARSDLSPGLRGLVLNKQRMTIFYWEPTETRPRLTISRVLRQERDVSGDDFA